MKKVLAFSLSALMVVGLTGCSSGGGTAAATASTAAGSAAADGGKLVIYSPNTDDLINAVVPLYEEKYGVKVEVITGGTGDLMTRIDSEKENPQGDVMYGGVQQATVTKYPDAFAEYTSPNDALLPTEYQSYKGIVSHYALDGSAALLINTDIYSSLGLDPEKFTSYEDLLQPELKGHIAMGDPANSSSAWAELTNMLAVMGDKPYDDKAWEWVGKFIENLDGIMLDSSSKIYKGTADGEYAVGVSYEDPCVNLLVSGATNLKLVYPSEGAVWLPAGVAIIKNCQNEVNAQHFIDFLQSDEGQKAIATTTARPANTSISNTSELMTPLSEIKVVVEDIDYCSEMKPEWQQKWTDMFTSAYK